MPTNAQHHRPVSLDQSREGRLLCLSTASEVIQQTAIRHRAQRPDVKERTNLPVDRRFRFRHEHARSFFASNFLDRSYYY
jgi:hypothetical protein